MVAVNVCGESIEGGELARAGLPRPRVSCLVAYGFVTMGLLGCESRDVLLGRGNSDAGSNSSSFAEASSSEAASASPASASSSQPASNTSELSSAEARAATSSAAVTERSEARSEANTGGDVCNEIYGKCMDETPGAMCQDVLIFCRIALPDGGPPCEDVYSQCVQMGYSEQDCERAASACEEGGGPILGPDVDSTLHVAE